MLSLLPAVTTASASSSWNFPTVLAVLALSCMDSWSSTRRGADGRSNGCSSWPDRPAWAWRVDTSENAETLLDMSSPKTGDGP